MANFKTIILISLILVVTFVAFLPCLQNSFVNLEDNVYITDAQSIQHLSLKNIKRIFTSFFLTVYQPFSRLSFLLEYRFFKLNPFVCHLTNIILYLFTCFFVFWLMYLLTKRISISSIAAILFALHPLHVQSVAWVSDRNDLLSAGFFFAAIICYCYYLREARINKYYYLSLILFIFSLLSKAMSITLPIILLLVDYLLRRKPDKRIFLDKIPFFILSFVFSIAAIIGKYSSGTVNDKVLPFFSDRLMVAVYAIIFYIKKTLLPVKLSCIYPYSGIKDAPPFLDTFAIFMILFLAVVISRRYTRKVIFGSAFFLVSLLPVLQFIPIKSTIVADRYVYVASFGLFYLAACGFVWLYKKIPQNTLLIKKLLSLLLILIICALFYLTWKRCQVWKGSLTLWDDVLTNYPTRADAYNNRGVTYYLQGNLEHAIPDYSKAIEINPSYVVAYYNRANAYYDHGDLTQAISDYSKVIELAPGFAEAYQRRILAYYENKEYDKAWADVRKVELLGYEANQILLNELKKVSKEKTGGD